MYICTHRCVAVMFTAAIVLSLGATSAHAAEHKTGDTLFALVDSDSVPRAINELTFPDQSGSLTIVLPLREDRAIDFNQTPQQALVPLPSSALSGLVGLGALTLLGSRKAITRFMT